MVKKQEELSSSDNKNELSVSTEANLADKSGNSKSMEAKRLKYNNIVLLDRVEEDDDMWYAVNFIYTDYGFFDTELNREMREDIADVFYELKESGKDVVYLAIKNDYYKTTEYLQMVETISTLALKEGLMPYLVTQLSLNDKYFLYEEYEHVDESRIQDLINKISILPSAFLRYVVESRTFKLGFPRAIESLGFDKKVEDLCSMIDVGLQEVNNEIYKLTRKGERAGVITKKTNFGMRHAYNTITQTRSVTLEQVFNREILITPVGKKAKKVVVDSSQINSVAKLDEFLINVGHCDHAFKESEIREFINHVFDVKNPETLYISNNPGWNSIDGANVWLTENKVVGYKNNSQKGLPLVRLADKLKGKAPKIVSEKAILKDNKFMTYVAEAKEFFSISEKLSVQESVCVAFIYNLVKTYNSNVEPLLIIGLACLSPYVNYLVEQFKSFPVGYLEGYTATGKTNLLNLISCLFGFDSSYPKSGNDTALNILYHAQLYVNIPLLINEIGDKLRGNLNELVIKPIFDRTARRRMKSSGSDEATTAINSTLIFNVNAPINKEAAIINRLLHTYWEKGIFNVDEAKRFNEFTSYASILIPSLVENLKVEDIAEKIQKWVNGAELSHISDDRHKVNLAIALSGLEIVFELVNQESLNIRLFESKLKDYLLNYEKKAMDDEFEKVLFATRIALFGTHTILKVGTDYKEVMCGGRNGLHIDTGKNGEAFRSQVVNSYNANYRNSFSLRFIDYERLLNENGVKKEKATYGEGSKYGFFFPYDEFDNIELWSKEYNQGVRFINEADNATPVIKVGTEIF